MSLQSFAGTVFEGGPVGELCDDLARVAVETLYPPSKEALARHPLFASRDQQIELGEVAREQHGVAILGRARCGRGSRLVEELVGGQKSDGLDERRREERELLFLAGYCRAFRVARAVGCELLISLVELDTDEIARTSDDSREQVVF